MKKKKKNCYVNNIFRNNLIPRIYCEKYYKSNTSRPKKKKNSQQFSQQLSWQTYYYQSTTSIGVKSFVKFFVSIDLLKIKILPDSC